MPVPKVIDFGIAKATDKWAVEKTLLTQFGQIVGTPEYASPEQADTMTGEVDESSDVYSLGVLLYELLIGAVPFDRHAAQRRVGRDAADHPRRRGALAVRKLTSVGAAATDIAARRQTDPVSLRRLVDGDLNSITMKALEKAHEQRYASVSDLAADIQRHMEDRPVLASPPGGVPSPQVSPQAQAGRSRYSRRTRGPPVERGNGLVAPPRESPPRPKLTEKDTIVLADFDNKTGDPVFDDTLARDVAIELQQSPFLP